MSEHIPQPPHAQLSNEPVEFAAEDFPPVTSGHVKIKEGTRVLTGMTAVKFDVITISSGVLRAHSNSPEPSVVIAQGTAAVHAYGNVMVLASDKARVYTYNGPYAVATGSSTVTALGTGNVVTYDTASARIHDNVTGVASAASGIEAHDATTVECTDTSRLSLHGQSVGVARGSSTIDVHDSARALAFGSVTADVYGGHVDLRERSKAVIQVPVADIKKQADGNYALIREGVGYGSVAVHNSASVVTMDDLRTPSAPFTPSAAEAAATVAPAVADTVAAPTAEPTAEPVTPAVAPTVAPAAAPAAEPVTASTVAPTEAPAATSSTAEEVVTVNDTVDAPTETSSPSTLITVGRSGVSATETEVQDQYLGTSVEPASPDERVDSTQSVTQLEELGWSVVTKPSGAYQPFERVDLAAQIDKESGSISNQPATSSESKPKSERKGFNLPKPPETTNDGGFTIPGLNLAGN